MNPETNPVAALPTTRLRRFLGVVGLALATLSSSCIFNDPPAATASGTSAPPNILFVIMDDVGIDQLAALGYGGASAPRTPTIDAIARAGVRFRNTWSMPECSPGRAALMVGRYPLRTNVNQAIGPNDLAQSHITPYDMTVPKLLKQAGYESAMFGKFHLGGPENNPDEHATPAKLGWDYFYGWVGGLPGSLDTTAGGLAAKGTYSCGFVPSKLAGGADSGACHFATGACSDLRLSAGSVDSPGKTCVAQGGLFAPAASCQQGRPASLDFNRENAYYVSPLVINSAAGVEVVPLTDARARGYRTTIEANAAIDWIRGRSAAKPWMATVSFSAAHTPIQQPPSALVPGGAFGSDDLKCGGTAVNRGLQNHMIEALDSELGRVMVSTGLAKRNADGSIAYDPAATNTVIVIVGDNGTLGNAVKLPFDATRAKSTSYQTGVWVPLIVAGPLVASPDRNVESMVNVVDVYRLFGEMGGVNVSASVPRKIDSEPMLAYLTTPSQPPIRSYNFTQGGLNLQPNGGNNGPCLLGAAPGVCSLTPTTKGVCEDNAGVWWGAGATDASVPAANRTKGYANCCEVQRAVLESTGSRIDLLALQSAAIRNDGYKVVRNSSLAYDEKSQACVTSQTSEFYAVDQKVPMPTLDTAAADLLKQPLSASLQRVYTELVAQLDLILGSNKSCKGDGNLDGVVDAVDLANVSSLARSWGKSSVYDINQDGLTNDADIQLVRAAQGACPK